MSEWKEYRIGDLCEKVLSGGTPLTSNKEYYENGNIPWLKTTEVHKEIIRYTDTFITELGLKNSSAKLIPANSLIIAMYGDGGTAGKVALTKIPLSTNQACCNLVIDNNKAAYDFIYYYLKINYDNLVNLKTGGSQQNLNAITIKNFKINLPPLQTQQKIANILGTYDELIEVNNERIKILEETAQSIYKEWFVRFRFPNYQNTEFIKGVPKGWEVIKFRDFIKLNRGFDLPNDKIIEGEYPVIASTSTKAFHNEYKSIGEGVITGRSGSLGVVQYINGKYWALNTALYVKDFKGNLPKYVYYFLKEMHLENYDSGAGIPSLNQNHLHGLSFPLPPIILQNNFNEIISPMFTQIEILKQQNTELRQIRDRLLPRLISGKLPV
jgi:type I restriction enzyme, S subunit